MVGGYPISGLMVGGNPILGLMVGGYPIPGLMVGVYPIPGLMVGGVPHPRSDGEGYLGYPPGQVWMVEGTQGTPPGQVRMGYPPTMTGWGTPLHQHSEHLLYAAGGMPLAFTQEDFLILEYNFYF